MSMITATAWVPRGHAAAFPTRYVFDEEEYARISKLAKLELDDAKEDLENARQALNKSSLGDDEGEAKKGDENEEEGEDEVKAAENSDDDDDLKEYDMEHYDDEPDGPENGAPAGEDGKSLFGNINSPGLLYRQCGRPIYYFAPKWRDGRG